MVSSILHTLPPIAPSKLPPTKSTTTASTPAIITTRLSNGDNMAMDEKLALPIRITRCRQHSIASSSFHDADPFVHSRQDMRDMASAFNTSLDLAQTLKDLISFLLFKPMIVPAKEGVQQPVQPNVDRDNHRPSKMQQQQQQQRRGGSSTSTRLKPSSSKSMPPGHWPSCVAPAIPPRKKDVNRISQVPAAVQQMRLGWEVTYHRMRDTRVNANELRMLAAEANMIRNAKITRPLRTRRYLEKRQDGFVWGRRSCLRICDNGAGDHNK